VITPVGGLEEQIEANRNGLIARKADVPSLAEALNSARDYNFDLHALEKVEEKLLRLVDTCVEKKAK
jgi:hypothetical protein